MIITKGFYTKTKYEVDETGVLRKSQRTFFGLFRSKDGDEELPLSEVKYIYNVPTSVGMFSLSKKNGVEFVAESTSMYLPKLSKAEADEFVEKAISLGAKDSGHEYMYIPSETAMRKTAKGYSLLCEQFGYITHKVFTNQECCENCVRPDTILYFDDIAEKGCKGIAFGSVAGGGDSRSIEIYGLSKEDQKSVHDYILKNNPRLTDTDVRIFKANFPLFSPSRWFRTRETLIVADWGVMHKQFNVVVNGKKYKTRTSVLPYESIKSYSCEGRLSKSFIILGSTSIETQGTFANSVKKYIWNQFKKHNVVNDFGVMFRSSLLYRWGFRGSSNDADIYRCRVRMNDTMVIYEWKKEVRTLEYGQIYHYDFVKEKWYHLYGNFIIKGRRVDARAGEGGDVDIVLGHVGRGKAKDMSRIIKAAQSKK